MTMKKRSLDKQLKLAQGEHFDYKINKLPLTFESKNTQFYGKFLHYNNLKLNNKLFLWNLLELNMKSSYEQSKNGWNPRFKKRELLNDRHMKYLIMFTKEDDIPISFISFKFDVEENMKDEFDYVVYCYEVQISQKFRSLGLGGFMMNLIEELGRAWQMEKLMLTVFTFNTRAISFYENIGFETDPISPNYPANKSTYEGEDYQIMSKSLD